MYNNKYIKSVITRSVINICLLILYIHMLSKLMYIYYYLINKYNNLINFNKWVIFFVFLIIV